MGSFTINLSQLEVKILYECTQSAVLSGTRPKAYAEELEAIENKFPILNSHSYFARLDGCSSKDGINQEGPFTTSRQIIDSLIKSLRCAREFKWYFEDKTGCRLYLIPWQYKWKNWIEFRVFIYHGNVTVISQYVWSKNLGIAKYPLSQWAECIINFCENKIVPEMHVLTDRNWVIDVIIDPSTSNVELVELNSFGAELSSGSVLFEWIRDKDILYSDGNTVEFRYVS